MSHQAHIELVETSFATHTPDAYAHDHEYHDPLFPGASVHEVVENWLQALPDAKIHVIEHIDKDDADHKSRIVTRWTLSGTHTGEIFGIKPTGKPVKITGTTIDHLAHGKIVATHVECDALGALQQIGLVPVFSA